MKRKIFVNLAVNDLKKSVAFFKELGFSFDDKFTNGEGACLVISDEIFSMLMTREAMRRFTKDKQVIDAKRSVETLLAVSLENRAEVDAIFEKAMKAGGSMFRSTEDHGWMYSRSIEDLDGHVWEFFSYDEAAVPKA